MSQIPQQLTLGISLGSDLGFENFVDHGNEDVLQIVRLAARESQFAFLWGEAGSGRTHLLHAACRAAADAGRRVALLPLHEAARWQAEAIEGWDTLDLVAVDDVQAIAGNRDWEAALFTLYNGLRDAGASLLVTANRPPAALETILPDLKSRFGAMLVYQLHALDDDGKLHALMKKARARGLELPEETGRYLLARVSRDMHYLAELLNRLDAASLAHQRRLTIPFVRELLA